MAASQSLAQSPFAMSSRLAPSPQLNQEDILEQLLEERLSDMEAILRHNTPQEQHLAADP